MTRSIFDPGGGETERSGSAFTPADADQISHMPPDVTDGDVEEEEDEAGATAQEQPGFNAAADVERQFDLEGPRSNRTQGEEREEVVNNPDSPPDDPQ